MLAKSKERRFLRCTLDQHSLFHPLTDHKVNPKKKKVLDYSTHAWSSIYHLLNITLSPCGKDIYQMDVNAIQPTDLPPPELAVTNEQGQAVTVVLAGESSSVANSDQPSDEGNENIREHLDKYSIGSNNKVTDDEVPHFPMHVLKEIHTSPTLAPNAAHISDPHDDIEDDIHTVNSADLDLEAVGKDSNTIGEQE
jgi:hypothetical protein